MIQLRIITAWEQILVEAKKSNVIMHSTKSYWWKIGEPAFICSNRPCGPVGEDLYVNAEPMRFILNAVKRKDFYGRHGLAALEAAYHGNVTRNGMVIGLETWEAYNRLIDLSQIKESSAEPAEEGCFLATG